MTFLELIKKRESVRKYLPKPVPKDAIERCLEAARLAPSACNSQAWKFIVINDANLKKKLSDEAFSGIYSMNSFAKEAPAIIAVVTERSKYIARLGGSFRGIQYNLIDIGIACEHLMLAAAEEGIGTCFIGWFNENAVKKFLGIRKENKIDILISLGYPVPGATRKKDRKPMDEIRVYNI